ncbi:HD domain-containing protein [Zavarzinia sp. CC-PAN008]|uniref:HD domain-containing protein n=1 Tax=Zavarzinia sp. CC-PAN008 TaxID=3243332 RepID=UPI003F745E85
MPDGNMTAPDHFDRAQFTAMQDGTAEDYAKIQAHDREFAKHSVDRVLSHLNLLAGDHGGFRIDRLTHSLQSATLAHRDGADEELVVCALLHDIGDTLGCFNHADIAAAILKPFVSEKNLWIIENHGIFQGYYFFQHLGLDRDMREQYRGHPYFQACADFCAKYDQNAFDPNYDTMPLEAFEPMVRRLMSRPKRSIYMKPARQAAE